MPTDDRMRKISFNQHLSPALRIHSGCASLGSLQRELGRVGAERAVILCGRSLADSELLQRLRSAMGHRCAGVIVRAQAHSPLEEVSRAAQELQALDADAIVAVGGGSAVVTARAAAILLAEGGDIHVLCSHTQDGRLISPRLAEPKLPQFVVPTTPNTAVVKAGAAVFDAAGGRRLALFDPKTRAQAIFIDPQFLMSAPRGLVIAASLDTLTLAVEGLLSPRGNPISDGLLIHAIRLLSAGFQELASCDDGEVRTELMLAAVLCGRGTDHTGAGLSTAIGHAVGARYGLDNGMVKAIVLPHVLRFNAAFARDGIAMLATALGIPSHSADVTERVIDAFHHLFLHLQVPTRLRDLGMVRDVLNDVAGACMADWFLQDNPRPINTAADIHQLLETAW